jgi:hypothetical protein
VPRHRLAAGAGAAPSRLRRAQALGRGLRAAVDKGKQPLGVGPAAAQRVENRPPADADDIAQRGGELEVGVLQRLLDPLPWLAASRTGRLRVRSRARIAWVGASVRTAAITLSACTSSPAQRG